MREGTGTRCLCVYSFEGMNKGHPLWTRSISEPHLSPQKENYEDLIAAHL
jgi:hypothetical protein